MRLNCWKKSWHRTKKAPRKTGSRRKHRIYWFLPKRGGLSMKKLWISLLTVFILSFTILGRVGTEIFRQLRIAGAGVLIETPAPSTSRYQLPAAGGDGSDTCFRISPDSRSSPVEVATSPSETMPTNFLSRLSTTSRRSCFSSMRRAASSTL